MALKRKKTAQVTVVHRVHGEGQLIERRDSPSGNAMLGVRFPDGMTRLLLAAPEFWLTLPDLGEIPVVRKIAQGDEPDDGPEIDGDGDGDVEVA